MSHAELLDSLLGMLLGLIFCWSLDRLVTLRRRARQLAEHRRIAALYLPQVLRWHAQLQGRRLIYGTFTVGPRDGTVRFTPFRQPETTHEESAASPASPSVAEEGRL